MDRSRDETSEMPSLILPYLFLGGKVVARSRESLDKLNIRSIINCTPSRNTDPRAGVPNFFQADKDRFTYLRVPVFDSKGSNLAPYFERCANFIDQSKHHGAVLVHCVQGVSRSTSIVLAYLMKKKGVPLQKALNFVKKRRPIVRPNRSFMEQLQNFENRCQAEKRRKEAGTRMIAGPARPTQKASTAAPPTQRTHDTNIGTKQAGTSTVPTVAPPPQKLNSSSGQVENGTPGNSDRPRKRPAPENPMSVDGADKPTNPSEVDNIPTAKVAKKDVVARE